MLAALVIVGGTPACTSCEFPLDHPTPAAILSRGGVVLGVDGAIATFDIGVLVDGEPRYLRDAAAHTPEVGGMRATVDGVTVAVTLADVYAGTGSALSSILTLSATGDPARRIDGFVLDGVYTDEPVGILSEAFASWGLTDFVRVQDGDDPATFALGGLDDQHFTAEPRVSHWVGAARFAGETLVVGALDAAVWKTRVVTWRADDGLTHVRVVVGGTGAPVPLGEGRTSEPLVFHRDPLAWRALETYAALLRARHPPPDVPFTPVGWNSWNTFFTDIDAARIMAAVDDVDALLPGVINTVQIDDGWEVAWGDWTANERFPDGLAPLADALAARGLVPGVWWAPFLVDPASALVAAHPEWLLLDENGDRVTYGAGALGITYHALDVSRPEVRDEILTTLARLLDDGFLYLKLDFLFGGLYEGARFDPTRTALEHYHALVDELTARARDRGAYLLACGAPILPSLGRFHAIRTGDDIAFAGVAYTPGMNKNAFRNVSLRLWVNRAGLVADPDTILLRDLPRATQEQNIAAALLSGRIVALGDDIGALDDDRRALLARIPELPPFRRIVDAPDGRIDVIPLDVLEQVSNGVDTKLAHILDPDGYAVPELWYQPTNDGGSVLAVFNWWSDDVTRDVRITDSDGAPRDIHAATDLFSGEDVDTRDGAVVLTVPAHGVRLLQITR